VPLEFSGSTGSVCYENFLLGNLFYDAGMSGAAGGFLPELLPINQVKLPFENLIIEGHQGLSAAAGMCRTYGGSPRYLKGSVKGKPPSGSTSIDTCEDDYWGYDHRIICAPKEGCTDQELVNTTILVDSTVLPFYYFNPLLVTTPDFPDMEDVLGCEQSEIVVLKKGGSKGKKAKSAKKKATRK
jgi:hypothetical protein